MISKIKIGIILGSAIVASALVYAGVAHRHHEVSANAATSTTNPHVEQIPPAPKPAAGTPLNATNDTNQADATNDPNAMSQEEADQNANDQQSNNTVDDSRGSSTAQVAPTDASDSDQETTANVRAVRARPATRVRVVRVAQPVAAAVTATIDRPAASFVSVRPSAILVPSGTELTLRLAEPLGSKISQADQIFSGTIDQDIDIHGRTVIPAGAPVTGKVVVARAAGTLAGEASLQLQITSVKINRRDISVVTAVHNFGPIIQGKNKFGRFMKGLGKRMDGQEHEVLLAEQTAYTFDLSGPIQIR